MLNFSALDNRSILGRLARLPLKLLPAGLVIPVLQGPLRGTRWIVGSSDHGCWLGSYELEKQRATAAAIQPDHVVYDLGANVGFYTLLAARRAGPKGRVVAFEPVAGNVATLRRHVALNHCTNVDVIEAAVSDTDGEVDFQASASCTTGRVAVGGGGRVQSVTLDVLLTAGRIPPPDCMKIDIEGGEANALRGAASCLEQHRPLVFLATHGAEVHAECCRLLLSLGYRVEQLGSRSDELVARP